jgi:hypothetical protein
MLGRPDRQTRSAGDERESPGGSIALCPFVSSKKESTNVLEAPMNRRHALKTGLGVAAAAMGLRTDVTAGQGIGSAGVLYVNPATGNDANAGGQQSPLSTLAEAARRVNASSGAGAMTIVLTEGIHAIGETTLLRPNSRSFTRTERLTIRAEVLPDDPDWHIGRMPTLIHTMPLSNTWNGRPDALGGAADGMLIETSHVTVRGLRVLGLPVIESPRPGIIRRLYGISRLQRGQSPALRKDEPVSYRVMGSYFAGNRRLAGSGTGARLEYSDIDSSFLTLVDTRVVDQPVALESDQTRIDYLHPGAGSEAAKIGAGLFTKSRA